MLHGWKVLVDAGLNQNSVLRAFVNIRAQSFSVHRLHQCICKVDLESYLVPSGYRDGKGS